MDFKPGDKVRVRTPKAPIMVIEEWAELDGLWRGWRCAWFVQRSLRRDIFAPELLEPAPDP